MEVIHITKIIKVGNSKAIVIPTTILNGLDWNRGDTVLFTFTPTQHLLVKKLDDVTLRKLKQFNLDPEEPIIQI